MNKKLWLTWGGIVVGLFAIFEGVAIFDTDPNTSTLTANIINYIPADLFFVILGGGGLWIVWHFISYYLKKNNEVSTKNSKKPARKRVQRSKKR